MTTDAGPCPSTALIAAIRNGILAMAAPQARRLAEVVARHEAPTVSARGEGLAVAPVPAFRRAASGILDAWAVEPGVHGVVLAAALCAAVETAEALRATQAVDVVWTGPSSAEVPVRLTREVLLEVIRSATSSLVIVSYAAYRVPDIIGALGEAASRGVDVRLVLESAAGSGGRLSQDAAEAFRSLAGTVRVYEWPSDRRTSEGGLQGTMHAKAAIADEQAAFITSANLTGSAIEANMELGLLVRGGSTARRLARHFRALISMGYLVEIPW
jgi:phosphatidylserine/phosphatidylglycerophosphate/cardiolipin synthase-like enzyme